MSGELYVRQDVQTINPATVLSEKNDGGTSTNENQATGNVSGTINVRGSELSYKEAVVQGRLIWSLSLFTIY